VTNLSGRISRGNLTLYDPNLLNPPAGNVFAWFQINGDSSDSLTELIDRQHQTNSCAAGSREDAAKLLHVLDEDVFYVAYAILLLLPMILQIIGEIKFDRLSKCIDN